MKPGYHSAVLHLPGSTEIAPGRFDASIYINRARDHG